MSTPAAVVPPYRNGAEAMPAVGGRREVTGPMCGVLRAIRSMSLALRR
ncbi:MAG: hypothetical protein ACRDRN_22355 [Sciscionella sp.]